GERGALESHAPQGALLLVRREPHDLHDPEGLQGCQHVPGDGAATDDGHLVHRGDHGKIFSSTMAAAAARFAATLAERASAVSFAAERTDRKSTRLNSSHVKISYAVFCLKKKNR